MDSSIALIRRIVPGSLERIRKLVRGTEGVSPGFRGLVRNGDFERPVIERNHWSRKFVPGTDGAGPKRWRIATITCRTMGSRVCPS